MGGRRTGGPSSPREVVEVPSRDEFRHPDSPPHLRLISFLGETYAEAWSEPPALVQEATSECTLPVFGKSLYRFSVPEDAGIGFEIGTVSATDPNDDALTYTIAGGNTDGTFAIDANTSAIVVARPHDRKTGAVYMLAVRADDGSGDTVLTAAFITVKADTR